MTVNELIKELSKFDGDSIPEFLFGEEPLMIKCANEESDKYPAFTVARI